MSDRLIDQHVRRDEACQDANWHEVRSLQKQIDEITPERHGLLASARGKQHEYRPDEAAPRARPKDKIGTVDDVILGDNGQVTGLIIGVGGFLGAGEKMSPWRLRPFAQR